MALGAHDIRVAMLKRWGAPEWAIMWEVAPATGAVHRMRYADAVMMSLWPSRGLELHGVEIKVTRSDWKREAADPTKAERIAAYCDRWWVHTGPGVITDASELPPLWGWREFDGSKWKTHKEAGNRADVVPCDRSFLAALLRRADEGERQRINEQIRKINADAAQKMQETIDAEVKRRTRHVDSMEKVMKAFEEASGMKLGEFTMIGEAARVGALIKAIQASGIDESWGGVHSLRRDLGRMLTRLDTAIANAKDVIQPPDPEAEEVLA